MPKVMYKGKNPLGSNPADFRKGMSSELWQIRCQQMFLYLPTKPSQTSVRQRYISFKGCSTAFILHAQISQLPEHCTCG